MGQNDDYVDGIQEKSELFRYFKEIGIVDSEELNGSIIFARDLDEEKPANLCTAFQGLNQVSFRMLLNHEDSTYVHEAVESILKSMLMIREDSYHVEYIMSQTEYKHCERRSSEVKHHVLLLLFGAMCIFSGLQIQILCGTLIFIAVVFVFCYIWKKFHALSMKCKVKKVRQLLFLQNEMILLVKKSLCLLRSRASTSSDPAIYTVDLFSKLSFVEKNKFIEQFATIPVLRNCLLEIVLNMTKHMHSVTKNMIETIPMISQIDDTHGYLCSYEWAKLGLEEFSSSNHGNITVDTLQRLTSFYIIIQSEFLRRLSLSLCPETWLMCTREARDEIWAAVENMMWEITRNSFKLTKHYWLYCGYEKERNIDFKKLKSRHVLCHNVDLFQTFQEWFLTLQEITNSVSFCIKQIESKNFEENEEKNDASQFCEMLDEVMVELGGMLKKSKSHFEICLRKVEKCFRNSQVSEQKCPDIVEADKYEDCKIIPVDYNDMDLEVEDEVFEDEVLSDLQTEVEDFDPAMFVEETKNKIRNKHYTLLFSELKNVLAYRMKKIQEREAKALEKKRLHAPHCSDLPSNHISLSKQSKGENLLDDPKKLCSNGNVDFLVEKSQRGIPIHLLNSDDHVEYINDNPVTSHMLTDSSQVVEISDKYFEHRDLDFETTAMELSKLSKTLNSSKYKHMCDKNICDSKTKTVLMKEELSFLNQHPFSGEYDKVIDDKIVSENVSLLKPSLVTRQAFEAAEVASGIKEFKTSSESPSDSDVQVFNIKTSLCFAQNKVQLTEDTFLYDPDEEN